MARSSYHLVRAALLILAASAARAQQPVPAGADSAAFAQATALIAGFKAESYDRMTPMLDPMIVRSIGGIAGIRRVLIGALDRELRNSGRGGRGEPEVIDVWVDSLLSILRTKKEVQCTLPLHVVVAGGDPYYCGTSTIAGYSSDNGVSWRFIIESIGTLESLRSMHSDFSSALRTVPVQVGVCDVARREAPKREEEEE